MVQSFTRQPSIETRKQLGNRLRSTTIPYLGFRKFLGQLPSRLKRVAVRSVAAVYIMGPFNARARAHHVDRRRSRVFCLGQVAIWKLGPPPRRPMSILSLNSKLFDLLSKFAPASC